ncbi:amidase signature domain-containing protein [Trichoderma austrokoningii]
MARSKRQHCTSILLVAIAGLLCLGSIAVGKSREMAMPIQPPPSILNLGEATYFVSPPSKHKSTLSNNLSIFGPCTVIRISNPYITQEDLAEVRDRFSQDDVWTTEFLPTLIIHSQNTHETVQFSAAAQKILEAWGSPAISIEVSDNLDAPSGPYYCNGAQLHEVYRLYPDTAGAFISATIQSPTDPYLYKSFNVSVFTEEYPSALTIGVPSRLYFTPTEEKPLAGLRIAVKDTQNVRGVKTTGSSRAWARLYGPQEKSAIGVQRLLDHGAIVVGKLKSTQFGESEWATRDWVDYHAPWNPRGDGYQTPSASSSGSAASVAAYDWLDLTTGTDCSGSVRAPAAIHGLFAIRPSTDAIDNQGVIPFSKNFDTFGIFTRDIDILSSASSVLYNQKEEIPACFKSPTRILYLSEYWPVKDEASSAIFENTIQQLESTLGIKRTELSLAKLWSETNTVGTELSIDDYFKTTFVTASAPDQWDMLKKFHAEYQSAFGHAPPLNPQLQWKLEFLPTQTIKGQKKGEKEVEVFRAWFEKYVLQADENGCSETILVLPWTQGKPSYRDEYGERPNWTGEGWFFYFIAVYGGAPEVILPIGQTPYHSRLTKRQEWLPVAIGLVGARGTDAALTSFIKDTVKAAKLPTTVNVGQTAFSLDRSEISKADAALTEKILVHQDSNYV